MRKGALAHIGHVLGKGHIGNFRDGPAGAGQLFQILRRDAGVASLELKVCNDGGEVGVAAPLPKADQRPLHPACARLHRHDAVGHRHPAVVVGVDAHRRLEPLHHLRRHLSHLIGEGAAVCLTQTDAVRSSPLRRLQRRQRVRGVPGIAVEKVLRVKDDLPAVCLEKGDALLDHPQVFLQRRVQDVGDVKVPALAKDADGGGVCLQQGAQALAVLGALVLASGAAEGRQPCMAERQRPHPLKKFQVLWIGRRIARLDVVDAQLVQRRHNPQLVLHRKGNVFSLRPVAQGGIQNPQLVCPLHILFLLFPLSQKGLCGYHSRPFPLLSIRSGCPRKGVRDNKKNAPHFGEVRGLDGKC